MTNEELAVKIRNGETALIETLWTQVRRFVYKEAGKWNRAFEGRNGSTVDDFIQSAYPALLRAIAYFDPDKEQCNSFLTAFHFCLRTAFSEIAGVRTKKACKSPLDHSLSLNAPIVSDDEDFSLENLIEDEQAYQEFQSVEDQVLHEQLCAILYPMIEELTPDQQEILFARYWEGLSCEEIGERGGVSRQRVHQIESAALQRLRRHPVTEQLKTFL